MFIGSINEDLRGILAEFSRGWKGLSVYVGCSGNFTVERVLANQGMSELHGNDVSLYSSYVGSYLAGRAIRIGIADERFSWLERFLKPGIETIATLLLSMEMVKFIDRREPYHLRMLTAYLESFADLHKKTVERVRKSLNGLSLTSFYCGDVFQHLRSAPEEAVFISFPPTYKGGYERLYEKMNGIFSWDPVEYVEFDDKRFVEFLGLLTARRHWVTLRDHPVPEMEASLKAIVQTGMRSKPVYVYSGDGKARLALAHQRIDFLNIPRFGSGDEIHADSTLTLAEITQGQMNLLRSSYLSPSIIPATALFNLGVLVDGKLIGALGFQRSKYGTVNEIYMMSDFAIRPIRYRRGSKLVLAAAVSREIKDVASQRIGSRVERIHTTAFTNRPSSMKYRGLFEVTNRKEGLVNFVAEAGKWNLKEGLAWWNQRHSQILTD